MSTNFDSMKIVPLYNKAYLINQKVEFVNGNPLEDRHWNLGNINYNSPPESLIRTPNNELLLTPQDYESCPDGGKRRYQLNDYFFHIIAFLIANEYPSLPTNNFKIALMIGHPGHSTALMVSFRGIDNDKYKSLYEKFYHDNKTNPNLTKAVAKSQEKSDREFVQNHKYFHGKVTEVAPWTFRLTRNKFDEAVSFLRKQTNINITDSHSLPLKVNEITLEHYETLQTRSYVEKVRETFATFIKIHQCRFIERDCPKQEGLTCRDWTLYNLYRNGLGLNGHNPSSTQLRELTEKKTLDLTQAILYPKIVAEVKNNSASFDYRNTSLAASATIILITFSLITLFQWALLPAILLSCLMGLMVGGIVTNKPQPLANANKPCLTIHTEDNLKPNILYQYPHRIQTKEINDVNLELSTSINKIVKRR